MKKSNEKKFGKKFISSIVEKRDYDFAIDLYRKHTDDIISFMAYECYPIDIADVYSHLINTGKRGRKVALDIKKKYLAEIDSIFKTDATLRYAGGLQRIDELLEKTFENNKPPEQQ